MSLPTFIKSDLFGKCVCLHDLIQLDSVYLDQILKYISKTFLLNRFPSNFAHLCTIDDNTVFHKFWLGSVMQTTRNYLKKKPCIIEACIELTFCVMSVKMSCLKASANFRNFYVQLFSYRHDPSSVVFTSSHDNIFCCF